MNREPYIVEFEGILPRRLFVPLFGTHETDGDERTMRVDPSASLGGSAERVALYWQLLKNGSKSWRKTVLANGQRVPTELWHDAARVWQRAATGEKPTLGKSSSLLDHLDVSLVFNDDVTRSGLLLTWNPRCVLEPGNTAQLLIQNGELSAAPPPWLAETDLQFIVLSLPMLVVYRCDDPREPLGKVERKKPPQLTILGRIMSLIKGNPRTNFKPRSTRFVATVPSAGTERTAVTLDFGAAGTTVAILESGKSGVPWRPISHLHPWSQVTYSPDYGQSLDNASRISCHPFTWGGARKTLPDGLSIVPRHVLENRRVVPQTERDYANATILYDLPAPANELTEKSFAIGTESDKFLREIDNFDLRLADVVWSLKARVAEETRGDEHPTQRFLREVFDQAAVKLQSRGLRIRPIEKLCYSYPVSWTNQTKKLFKEHVRKAFETSRLAQFARTGVEPISDDFCLDEATAAFLGTVQIRHGVLDGGDLVDIFTPYDPSPTDGSPKTRDIHALVVDCGASTTNMVLLRITDNASSKEQPVESYVIKHFAYDRGGLEITRQIAAHLKEQLRQAKANVKLLRTTIHEKVPKTELESPLSNDLEPHERQRHAKSLRLTRGDYRRLFILRLYREAERIKQSASNGSPAQPAWDKIIIDGLMPKPQDSLNVSQQQITELVSEVFRPAFTQIANWMREGPRLDLLVLTGRSTQLPGFFDQALAAIPPDKHPPTIDRITGSTIRLYDDPSPANEQELLDRVGQAAKTVVAAGLARQYFNKTRTISRALLCHPIDEKRRTRCFGLLEDDGGTNWRPIYRGPEHVLIRPDNETIDPEFDIIFAESNPTSRRLFIGMSFCEPTVPPTPGADAPLPYLHIDIQGGKLEAFRQLRFHFRQRSSTDLLVDSIELIRASGEAKSIKVNNTREVSLDNIRIALRPMSVNDDFRETGRIHTTGSDAIDAN